MPGKPGTSTPAAPVAGTQRRPTPAPPASAASGPAKMVQRSIQDWYKPVPSAKALATSGAQLVVSAPGPAGVIALEPIRSLSPERSCAALPQMQVQRPSAPIPASRNQSPQRLANPAHAALLHTKHTPGPVNRRQSSEPPQPPITSLPPTCVARVSQEPLGAPDASQAADAVEAAARAEGTVSPPAPGPSAAAVPSALPGRGGSQAAPQGSAVAAAAAAEPEATHSTPHPAPKESAAVQESAAAAATDEAALEVPTEAATAAAQETSTSQLASMVSASAAAPPPPPPPTPEVAAGATPAAAAAGTTTAAAAAGTAAAAVPELTSVAREPARAAVQEKRVSQLARKASQDSLTHLSCSTPTAEHRPPARSAATAAKFALAKSGSNRSRELGSTPLSTAQSHPGVKPESTTAAATAAGVSEASPAPAPVSVTAKHAPVVKAGSCRAGAGSSSGAAAAAAPETSPAKPRGKLTPVTKATPSKAGVEPLAAAPAASTPAPPLANTANKHTPVAEATPSKADIRPTAVTAAAMAEPSSLSKGNGKHSPAAKTVTSGKAVAGDGGSSTPAAVSPVLTRHSSAAAPASGASAPSPSATGTGTGTGTAASLQQSLPAASTPPLPPSSLLSKRDPARAGRKRKLSDPVSSSPAVASYPDTAAAGATAGTAPVPAKGKLKGGAKGCAKQQQQQQQGAVQDPSAAPASGKGEQLGSSSMEQAVARPVGRQSPPEKRSRVASWRFSGDMFTTQGPAEGDLDSPSDGDGDGETRRGGSMPVPPRTAAQKRLPFAARASGPPYEPMSDDDLPSAAAAAAADAADGEDYVVGGTAGKAGKAKQQQAGGGLQTPYTGGPKKRGRPKMSHLKTYPLGPHASSSTLPALTPAPPPTSSIKLQADYGPGGPHTGPAPKQTPTQASSTPFSQPGGTGTSTATPNTANKPPCGMAGGHSHPPVGGASAPKVEKIVAIPHTALSSFKPVAPCKLSDQELREKRLQLIQAIADAAGKTDPCVNVRSVLRNPALTGLRLEYRRMGDRKRGVDSVRYVTGNGTITAGGLIQCYCNYCKAQPQPAPPADGGEPTHTTALLPAAFELHSHSGAKKPSEYTFLADYEVSLRDLMTDVAAHMGIVRPRPFSTAAAPAAAPKGPALCCFCGGDVHEAPQLEQVVQALQPPSPAPLQLSLSLAPSPSGEAGARLLPHQAHSPSPQQHYQQQHYQQQHYQQQQQQQHYQQQRYEQQQQQQLTPLPSPPLGSAAAAAGAAATAAVVAAAPLSTPQPSLLSSDTDATMTDAAAATPLAASLDTLPTTQRHLMSPSQPVVAADAAASTPVPDLNRPSTSQPQGGTPVPQPPSAFAATGAAAAAAAAAPALHSEHTTAAGVTPAAAAAPAPSAGHLFPLARASEEAAVMELDSPPVMPPPLAASAQDVPLPTPGDGRASPAPASPPCSSGAAAASPTSCSADTQQDTPMPDPVPSPASMAPTPLPPLAGSSGLPVTEAILQPSPPTAAPQAPTMSPCDGSTCTALHASAGTNVRTTTSSSVARCTAGGSGAGAGVSSAQRALAAASAANQALAESIAGMIPWLQRRCYSSDPSPSSDPSSSKHPWAIAAPQAPHHHRHHEASLQFASWRLGNGGGGGGGAALEAWTPVAAAASKRIAALQQQAARRGAMLACSCGVVGHPACRDKATGGAAAAGRGPLEKLRPGKGLKRGLTHRASDKAAEKADRRAEEAADRLANAGSDGPARKPRLPVRGRGLGGGGGEVEEGGEDGGGSGRVNLGCPMAVKPSAARMFQRQRNKHRRLFDGDKTGLQVGLVVKHTESTAGGRRQSVLPARVYSRPGPRPVSHDAQLLQLLAAPSAQALGMFATSLASVMRARAASESLGPCAESEPDRLGAGGGLAALGEREATQRRVAPAQLGGKPRPVPTVSSALQHGDRVFYVIHGQKLLEGSVHLDPTGISGILCSHCSTVISCSGFESHAGHKQRRNPYDGIVTEEGVTLRKVAERLPALEPILNPGAGAGPGAGGMLSGGMSSGRIARSSANNKPHGHGYEDEDPGFASSCVLCHAHDFCKDSFGDRTVMICDQCEKEYHVGCLRDHGVVDLTCVPQGDWFCSDGCRHIRTQMHLHLNDGEQHADGCGANGGGYTWQLLKGKHGSKSSSRVLASALGILQDSFDPIICAVSGQDLLPKMVQATTIGEWDFTNMYTALLHHRGRPVCAAVLRVFGTQLAELPLVATSSSARRQGHCRVLMAILEDKLKGMGISVLSLPAAKSAVATWKGGFAFTTMPEASLSVAKAELHMLTFPGTTVLSKTLIPHPDHPEQQLVSLAPPRPHHSADEHAETDPVQSLTQRIFARLTYSERFEGLDASMADADHTVADGGGVAMTAAAAAAAAAAVPGVGSSGGRKGGMMMAAEARGPADMTATGGTISLSWLPNGLAGPSGGRYTHSMQQQSGHHGPSAFGGRHPGPAPPAYPGNMYGLAGAQLVMGAVNAAAQAAAAAAAQAAAYAGAFAAAVPFFAPPPTHNHWHAPPQHQRSATHLPGAGSGFGFGIPPPLQGSPGPHTYAYAGDAAAAAAVPSFALQPSLQRRLSLSTPQPPTFPEPGSAAAVSALVLDLHPSPHLPQCPAAQAPVSTAHASAAAASVPTAPPSQQQQQPLSTSSRQATSETQPPMPAAHTQPGTPHTSTTASTLSPPLARHASLSQPAALPPAQTRASPPITAPPALAPAPTQTHQEQSGGRRLLGLSAQALEGTEVGASSPAAAPPPPPAAAAAAAAVASPVNPTTAAAAAAVRAAAAAAAPATATAAAEAIGAPQQQLPHTQVPLPTAAEPLPADVRVVLTPGAPAVAAATATPQKLRQPTPLQIPFQIPTGGAHNGPCEAGGQPVGTGLE
ncbi:MAG: hypothetical protein WDW38_009924 [Sanguina aurantia]